MTNKTYILILAIFFISCNKNENYIIPERTFYNFPSNKLWAHRVNTALEANGLLKKFSGIETDVFFTDEQNEFQTGHDGPSGRTLDSFFDSIVNPSKFYYWIDYKNLSDKNVLYSLSEMKRIVNKYNLAGRLIVESSHPELLSYFKCDEIFTSYWIPEINVAIPYFAENKLAKEIKADIEQYHFDALSCSYEMCDFFQRYFSNYNIHLWTNDLKGKLGVKKIRELASNQNVKIILVDYNRNFMKDLKIH
jgi:hypothetical protein